jgi:hypothetical protein
MLLDFEAPWSSSFPILFPFQQQMLNQDCQTTSSTAVLEAFVPEIGAVARSLANISE